MSYMMRSSYNRSSSLPHQVKCGRFPKNLSDSNFLPNTAICRLKISATFHKLLHLFPQRLHCRPNAVTTFCSRTYVHHLHPPREPEIPAFMIPYDDLKEEFASIFKIHCLSDLWSAFVKQHDFSTLLSSTDGFKTFSCKNLLNARRLQAQLYERQIVENDILHICSQLTLFDSEFLHCAPDFYEPPISRREDFQTDDMMWHRQLGWKILDHQDPQIAPHFARILDDGEIWLTHQHRHYLAHPGYIPMVECVLNEGVYSVHPELHLPNPPTLPNSLMDPNAKLDIKSTIYYNPELLRIDVSMKCTEIGRELVISFQPNFSIF